MAFPAEIDKQVFALGDFPLESGVTLPDAKIAYVTLGTPNHDGSNAVLLPSWYCGDYTGYEFLIGEDKALNPDEYFIVLTEMFANGASSSPSNTPPPYDRGNFPRIAIRDNVRAAHRLLTTQLGITHLKAVIGFSMGAQQAFQWAVSYPDFLDGVVASCGTAKTYPHGVARLESAISTLKADAAFQDGNYSAFPEKGFTAWAQHWCAWMFSQEWYRQELFKANYESLDALLHDLSFWQTRDANDLISHAMTWQQHNVGTTEGFDGDHEKALRSIVAKVLYLPGQTDLYFPIGDVDYEAQFISRLEYTPIPSIWGHTAGGGSNPDDSDFFNRHLRAFMAQLP